MPDTNNSPSSVVTGFLKAFEAMDFDVLTAAKINDSDAA